MFNLVPAVPALCLMSSGGHGGASDGIQGPELVAVVPSSDHPCHNKGSGWQEGLI